MGLIKEKLRHHFLFSVESKPYIRNQMFVLVCLVLKSLFVDFVFLFARTRMAPMTREVVIMRTHGVVHRAPNIRSLAVLFSVGLRGRITVSLSVASVFR